MLRQRVITALVLVALLLASLMSASRWPFALLTLALMAAAGWEWGRLNHAPEPVSLALGAAVALFRFKRGVIPVIATCAVVGLVWTLVRP
jgi:phosphatidate cytidylyltransferase